MEENQGNCFLKKYLTLALQLINIIIILFIFHYRALCILFKVTAWLPAIILFANGNWRIYVNETQKVWDKMKKRDNELFYNDLRTLEWDLFCYSYWTGLRVYVIKDPMDTLDKALKRYHFIQGIFKVFCSTLILFFLYYFREYFLMLLVPFHNFAIFFCLNCKG